MMAKYCSSPRHASRSNEAISCLHGPHQLAHTLISSGLPRNELSFRAGPLSPCSVASRSVPPIGTSAEVIAANEHARVKQSKRADRYWCDRLNRLPIGAHTILIK
jgi:hypothetical protein